MASVKQFPGSTKWSACYKIPTGQINAKGQPLFKRVQKSTGLTDKGKAMQIAIAKEGAAILVAKKEWTEHSAQSFLQEMSAISGVKVAQVQETESFLRDWLKAKKLNAAESTGDNHETVIEDFLKWLGPDRAKRAIINVTPKDIAGFRDAERKLGKSANTVNKALSTLRQLFDEAVLTLALERNPTKGLDIANAQKNAQQRTPFTFAQFKELYRRTGPNEMSSRGRLAHPDWQPFIAVTGYTGARQQEVVRLEWANVNFDSGMIGFRRSKSLDVHWMPMHKSLHPVLLALKKSLGKASKEPFVFPYLAGLPERSISKIFRETILPRIGIRQPYAKKSDAKGVGRVLAKYSIHSLRHSIATWLRVEGVEEMMRIRLVGHRDKKINRIYTHTDIVQAAAELNKVPSL